MIWTQNQFPFTRVAYKRSGSARKRKFLSVCQVPSLLAVILCSVVTLQAATTNYVTGFEASQGYSTNLALGGQNGWICVMAGSAGTNDAGTYANGVVDGYISGLGQQAYVGRTAMPIGYETLYAWQSINLDPIPAATTVVKCSVTFQILDSSNGEYNDFYWEVYNTQGDRLFTLDFDNYSMDIYYWLSGTSDFELAGRTFENVTTYSLEITMDFAGNTWSATLNGTPLIGPLQMAPPGIPRNLGDINADFDTYFNDAIAGDNFMVFDNLQIRSEQRPTLSVLSARAGSPTTVRLVGENGNRYAIDTSTNLVNWLPLGTNTVSGGVYDQVDAGSASRSNTYYRGRWLP
jgi:hypothetical protein